MAVLLSGAVHPKGLIMDSRIVFRSIFLTALTFLLSGPPYHYSVAEIGLFSLAGTAGAFTASAGGRFADRGWAGKATAAAAMALMLSWLPLGFGMTSLASLVIGIVVLDFGTQLMHITNQSEIFRLNPEARSRLNSAYMTSAFLGGALGSALASLAFASHGWLGVSLVGALFAIPIALIWALQITQHLKISPMRHGTSLG